MWLAKMWCPLTLAHGLCQNERKFIVSARKSQQGKGNKSHQHDNNFNCSCKKKTDQRCRMQNGFVLYMCGCRRNSDPGDVFVRARACVCFCCAYSIPDEACYVGRGQYCQYQCSVEFVSMDILERTSFHGNQS